VQNIGCLQHRGTILPAVTVSRLLITHAEDLSRHFRTKFRSTIGTDVAAEALRDYRRRYPKRLETVWRFAEVDRVARVIRAYVEAGG
jgi:hypothetical protein